MNTNLFRGLVVAALLSGTVASAEADDMTTMQTYDWSGVHIGVFAGYGAGETDWTYPLYHTETHPDFSGALGGVMAGASYQNGSYVVGVEGDIAAANWQGSASCPNTDYDCEVDFDWMATVRGRAGIAFDQTLIYATGGVAGIGGTGRTIELASGDAVEIASQQWGWTAGAGIEWGVLENISLRGEALFFDLGHKEYGSAAEDNLIRLGLTGYQVRAGLIWRFP